MYNFSLQYLHLALPTSELCVISTPRHQLSDGPGNGKMEFMNHVDGPATRMTVSPTIVRVLILIYLLLYYFIVLHKCYDSTLWPVSGCVEAFAWGVHVWNNLFLIIEFQVTLNTGGTGQ